MTNSKIVLNWTPATNSVSQNVQRATSANGPWTTLASLSASVSTYTDSTVVSNPHTDYFYRIQNICSSGTSYSSVMQEEARCCPEDNKTYIFTGRDTTSEVITNPYTGSQQIASVYIQYKDGLFNWINNTYNSNKNTTRSIQLAKSTSTDLRRVFCGICSEQFSIDTTNPNSNNSLTPQVTYNSEQTSLVSQLPTPPSAFGGNNYNNLGNYWGKQIPAGNQAPAGEQIQFGFTDHARTTFQMYRGKYVKSNSSNSAIVNYAPSSASFQDYSHAGAPMVNTTTNAPTGNYYNFMAIRLPKMAGRYHPTSGSWGDANSPSSNSSHPLRDFSTPFSSIPTVASNVGISTSGWRIAIFDTGWFNVGVINNPGRCLLYVYDISRNSNYDYTNTSGVTTHYGFDINPVSFNVDWQNSTGTVTYYAHSMNPVQSGDPLPYNVTVYDQPNLIIKFWQT